MRAARLARQKSRDFRSAQWWTEGFLSTAHGTGKAAFAPAQLVDRDGPALQLGLVVLLEAGAQVVRLRLGHRRLVEDFAPDHALDGTPVLEIQVGQEVHPAAQREVGHERAIGGNRPFGADRGQYLVTDPDGLGGRRIVAPIVYFAAAELGQGRERQ